MTDMYAIDEELVHEDEQIDQLKRAFGCFVTGVTVATIIAEDGEPRGFTANSFTSVSLHPPLCLICVGDQVRSFEEFKRAEHYAVSVLAGNQELVSRLFASDDDDRFNKVRWEPAASGSPILNGALSWFDCKVVDRVTAADHMILIAEIEAFGSRGGDGLGYFRSDYRRIPAI
ncbi:MAG: flavin reductase family protein [Pseudomonadota bacterium]